MRERVSVRERGECEREGSVRETGVRERGEHSKEVWRSPGDTGGAGHGETSGLGEPVE